MVREKKHRIYFLKIKYNSTFRLHSQPKFFHQIKLLTLTSVCCRQPMKAKMGLMREKSCKQGEIQYIAEHRMDKS